MTLDSDNIRFVGIFAGVPWKGGVIQQCGNRKRVFLGVSDATYSAPQEMRPILVHIIIQSLVAFLLTPKYVTLYDFEWLEWPFYVICSLLRIATGSLFVAYLVSFVYYMWCEERRSAGSGVQQTVIRRFSADSKYAAALRTQAYCWGCLRVLQHPQAVGNFQVVGNFRLSVGNFHNISVQKTHSLLLQKCFKFTKFIASLYRTNAVIICDTQRMFTSSGVDIQGASGAYAPTVTKIHNLVNLFSGK